MCKKSNAYKKSVQKRIDALTAKKDLLLKASKEANDTDMVQLWKIYSNRLQCRIQSLESLLKRIS